MTKEQARQSYMAAVIRQRLGDYKAADANRSRDELVKTWRAAYPDAANEASSALKPLVRLEPTPPKRTPKDPDEMWFNDTYFVTVRRHKRDPVFESKGGMVQLGISSHDGTARHDWRDFQAIKNQLAGHECEAFELYPADSRLLDPSNYFTIWAFPSINQIKVGHGPDLREVRDADEALAPQRALER